MRPGFPGRRPAFRTLKRGQYALKFSPLREYHFLALLNPGGSMFPSKNFAALGFLFLRTNKTTGLFPLAAARFHNHETEPKR
jgi:hypothetical protein